MTEKEIQLLGLVDVMFGDNKIADKIESIMPFDSM